MSHRTTVIADHHKSVFVCQVLDLETGEVRNATLKSTREALEPFFEALPGPTQVFVEACRSWEWVADLCEDLGIDFHLVNPRYMPEIARSTKKSDRADVEAMVRRFQTTGLPEARVASRAEREFRGLTRELTCLRKMRRVTLQRLHALVDAHGMPANKKLFASEEWRQAKRALLPARTRMNLDLLLARFDLVCEQVATLEKEIGSASQHIEDIRILQTIPGVGPVIAATIHAEIPDVTLFESGRALASFAGIVPSVRSSGGKTRIGRITKRGPSALRWALTQAVHASQTANQPSAAYLMHARKKRKGKAPKVALCAAANKLVRTIYAMLKNRSEYRHGTTLA